MLCLQDARARALIEQPDLQDGQGLKEGCLALLLQATPLEEQALLGTALHCLRQSLPILDVHVYTAAVPSMTVLSCMYGSHSPYLRAAEDTANGGYMSATSKPVMPSYYVLALQPCDMCPFLSCITDSDAHIQHIMWNLLCW